MSEDKSGRELTPRDPDQIDRADSSVTPVGGGDGRDVERFSAGPRAHSVGLTEERSAQIVRQSGNARNVVFLALLIIALFIPVYWFYEQGIPAVGAQGRLEAELEVQHVADVARGYSLYLANCARCHGEEGQGGIGPPLNNQPKLYNAVTAAGDSGTGHLNPEYLNTVLTVGGRYVCGDPNSLMQPWLSPNGPLDYRQVEELIAWITASSEIIFDYAPESHAVDAPHVEPVKVRGWRDPNWEPEPGATPPPACWRNPSGVIGGGAAPATPAPNPDATPVPIDGGTADEPRVIILDATADLHFVDPNGVPVTGFELVPGETVQFDVTNTAGFDHNFYIGTPDQLGVPNNTTDLGIPAWQAGQKTLDWVVPEDAAGTTLQFACTIPGHYSTMHGDIVIQS